MKGKLKMVTPKFVDLIPEVLEDGVLYISIPYDTATHKCACGCGELVVTPIKPTDWRFTWNGESITLHPSIGNWSLPCQSHYLIIGNKIVWAGKWTKSEIEKGRKIDKKAKSWFYGKIRKK